MRIGWRKLLGYLTRKPSEFFSVGVEVDVNEISLSVFKVIDKQLTWVLSETLPINGWQESLKKYVAENKLENTNCVIAFSAKKYQLLQVDRPPVEDAELGQALQWSVQELLSVPDEMLVDYFDLPAQAFGANKVNVAAMKKADVDEVCKGFLNAGLFIKAITIEELALCDLLSQTNDAVLTLVQKPNSEISLNIVKDGKLYFNRSIRGYESLGTFTELELQMGVIDNLTVEVQRSMDFFESQLRQGGVKRILLHLDTEHLGIVIDLVKKSMLIDVDMIELDLPRLSEVKPDSVSCASLGAALLKDYDANASEKLNDESGAAA